MKKLGKISSLMFTFASLANSSLATAPTTITPVATAAQETTKVNVAPLAIGALLICCVLFIGYKMDKAPENEPKIRPVKVSKMKKENKKVKKEKAEINYNENKNDIPYEKDVEFDDVRLNKEDGYEEDDVNIFMPNVEVESSFDNTDDDILFDDDTIQQVDETNFDSTMVFDSNELNKEINAEINNFENQEFFGIRPKVEENREEVLIEEVVEDDYEYTDPVEGLDEKIDSLDDLDDYNVEPMPEQVQDAESFMNELKKYEIVEENDEFEGFTTKTSKKEVQEKKAPKRYTRRKENTDVFIVDNEVVVEPEISEENVAVEISFLEQMEQNLKKDQETRTKKKESKVVKTTKEKSEKKTTKKKTNKKDE